AINPLLPKPFPMEGLANYLTFTQNVQRYWSGAVPPFNWYFLHTWSLALEEQFYLLWPALLCLAGRRRLIPLALGLVALAVCARAGGLHWWLLAARCDGFALGGLLAAILADRARWEHRLGPLQLGFGSVGLGALGLLAATLTITANLDFETAMSVWPS